MKIKLYGQIVLATRLTYDQANNALELANRSKATKHLTFHIHQVKKGKWDLIGSPIELARDFLDNLDDYLINID